MTAESPVAVKMSARKNLSSIFGELDREQNKADLKYWNEHFDSLFASKWGIDPGSGALSGQGGLQWERVTEDSEDVPQAYSMSSLAWACRPRAQRCTDLHHLGLSGSRPRASTPEPPSPRDMTPEASTPEGTREVAPQPQADGSCTPERPSEEPEVQEQDSEVEGNQDSCSLSELSVDPDRPRTPDQCATRSEPTTQASLSAAKHISVSNKRKQSSILEFYPQKKRTCVRKLPQS